MANVAGIAVLCENCYCLQFVATVFIVEISKYATTGKYSRVASIVTVPVIAVTGQHRVLVAGHRVGWFEPGHISQSH